MRALRSASAVGVIGAVRAPARADRPSGSAARSASARRSSTTTGCRAAVRTPLRTGRRPRVASWASCGSSPSRSASASAARNATQIGVVATECRNSVDPARPTVAASAIAEHGREVEVEQGVEGGPVGLPLDQRRGVRRAHLLAVEQVDRADSASPRRCPRRPRPRVPPSAARRRTRCAGRRRLIRRRSGRSSSLTARAWSAACLSTTPSVRGDGRARRGRRCRARAGCAPSRSTRRATATSSARACAASPRRARPARRGRARGSGTRSSTMSRSRSGDRVVEVEVEAAPLERLGQLAGGVRGEHDERAAGGGDGAHLRDRHLEVARAPRAAAPRPRRRSCRSRRSAARSARSRRIAPSSGRVSRNSSVKMSSWVCSHAWSAGAAWMRSSCFL